MFFTVIKFNVIIYFGVSSQDEIEKFKMDQIYMDIVKTEKEEKCMLEWLQTLYLHTYQMYLDPPPSAQLDSDDEAGPQANPRERINLNKDGIPIDKDGNPLKIDTAHSSKEQTTQQITNSETCESREGGESSQAVTTSERIDENSSPVKISAAQSQSSSADKESKENIASDDVDSNCVKSAGTTS